MKRLFLCCGLGLLLIAFVTKWLGAPAYCFWVLLAIAISCKTLFLISVFREKGFRQGPWLYLILAGVGMILISMLFRNIFPMPLLQKILFYSAITLKITGLLLMLISRKK